MERKLTQKELKNGIAVYFNQLEDSTTAVKSVSFDTRLVGLVDDPQPALGGCIVKFENGDVDAYGIRDTESMIESIMREDGYKTDYIHYNMNTKTVNDKIVPVFRGIEVECQELSLDDPAAKESEKRTIPKAKSIDLLSDMHKDELRREIATWEDQEVCEIVNAHFESHATMPGEKAVKDFVKTCLRDYNDPDVTESPWLGEDGKIRLHNSVCEENGKPTITEIGDVYVNARFRETKMEQSAFSKGLTPAALGNLERIDTYEDAIVSVYSSEVELQKLGDNVYVLAEMNEEELKSGKYAVVGKLPGNEHVVLPGNEHAVVGKLPAKFLTNNPMNVDSCKAELQIVDYSNGTMKNTSVRVVADSDLMSGDAIDLDEDMLAGLNQNAGLEQ